LRPDVLSNRITERRQYLNERITRAERTIERFIERSRAPVSRADAIFATLPARLKTQTSRLRDRLANLSRHADTAVAHQLTRARGEVAAQYRVLQSLSYENVLKRGFAVIRDDENRPVSQAAMLSAGSGISIQFADGRVGAVTTEGLPSSSTPKKRAQKPQDEQAPPKQGSLF
jgi:exodeoxyribonuclease VII large subunit